MKQQRSTTVMMLRALIPYTKENLLLSFSPNRFFNELEKATKINKHTYATAYYRAKKKGYFVITDNQFTITEKGFNVVKPFEPKKLSANAKLLLIFDIPHQLKPVRDKFRYSLKVWNFTQIQKSVWQTDKDYKKSLLDLIEELNLQEYVQFFESSRLYPK